jgi:hypothetical protein
MNLNDLHCDIYIHHPQKKRWELMRMLATSLSIPNAENITVAIKNSTYSLHIYDNEAGYGPTYYLQNDLSGHFFNYVIHYSALSSNEARDLHDHKEMHVENVSNLLNLLWTMGIPAATRCDFDEALPLMGGNDQENIFWKDEERYKW